MKRSGLGGWKRNNRTAGEQEFYACIRDLAEHPVVQKMKKIILSMGIQAVTGTVCVWRIIITGSADFWDWMPALRRGPACCMTCFCMTGIPTPERPASVFMA